MSDVELINAKHAAEIVGAWRTSDPIVPSLGYGGHPIAARPKKKALTIYEGRQPFQMEVPLLLSLGGASVEHLRVRLEVMATSAPGRSWIDEPPPGCRIYSRRGPLPMPQHIDPDQAWWIEDLKWGEELRTASGELVRKQVTVTLLEKVEDEAAPPGGAITQRAHNYIVRAGDTLASIAARELGSANYWTYIVQLNPAVRSDGNLHPGLILHLPAGIHSNVVRT